MVLVYEFSATEDEPALNYFEISTSAEIVNSQNVRGPEEADTAKLIWRAIAEVLTWLNDELDSVGELEVRTAEEEMLEPKYGLRRWKPRLLIYTFQIGLASICMHAVAELGPTPAAHHMTAARSRVSWFILIHNILKFIFAMAVSSVPQLSQCGNI
ncbi:hypothetical protein WAI453_000435 [Rhynchosporium graminicola]